MSPPRRNLSKLMLVALAGTLAIATMFTSSLRAADGEPGPICKIHPTSQKCQQPALSGCGDCVNDSTP